MVIEPFEFQRARGHVRKRSLGDPSGATGTDGRASPTPWRSRGPILSTEGPMRLRRQRQRGLTPSPHPTEGRRCLSRQEQATAGSAAGGRRMRSGDHESQRSEFRLHTSRDVQNAEFGDGIISDPPHRLPIRWSFPRLRRFEPLSGAGSLTTLCTRPAQEVESWRKGAPRRAGSTAQRNDQSERLGASSGTYRRDREIR